MKHNSEDISRLDGDIYEDRHGSLIDMSKIIKIYPVTFKDKMLVFSIVTSSGGNFYQECVHAWAFCAIDSLGNLAVGRKDLEDQEKEEFEMAETMRQDFINIWKEWKRRNKAHQ